MSPLHAAALTALMVGASAASGHGDEHTSGREPFDAARVEDTPFGRQGNPKEVRRTVQVSMSDSMRFTPSTITVRRGETVRFVIRNQGKLLHEMVLGTAEALKQHAELMKKFPEMEHSDPNMAHVKPGANGEIAWQFTKAGDFRFACLQPGHYEAGMVGKVSVK